MTTVSGRVPVGVLSDALVEAVAGRRVRLGVFTTFSFDPAFFESDVLPLLFDRPFSHVDKVKSIQLEDALRDVESLAVYYDRSALSQDAGPARLDVRRIDVRRSKGVFHPKIVLLLVDNESADDGEIVPSLIVGVMSANLTRAGWWENLEVAQFDEIPAVTDDARRIPYRKDLLSLIRRIQNAAPADESHEALDGIRRFLLRYTSRRDFENAKYGGKWYTRMFVGQKPLADWIRDLNLPDAGWNLEVVSPYFDGNDASTLGALVDAVALREVRIYLPREEDGAACLTERAYRSIAEIARWSDLPGNIIHASGRSADGGERHRRVHAKIYRLWGKHAGDLLLVGSVNLTRPAHSGGNAGNLEAAFLVDVSEDLPRQWWLKPLDVEPVKFSDRAEEHSLDTGERVLDVGLRYHWGRHQLEYRCHQPLDGEIAFAEPSGRPLFTIVQPRENAWVPCGEDAANAIRDLLDSTSFVLVTHDDHHWRVLVREEGMAHRPSLLSQLTAEEILRYWSLLTPEQRQTFIEQKLISDGTLEGLPISAHHDRLGSIETIFDRFAGIYHAFHRLRSKIMTALDDARTAEVDTLLLGAKYDSLPVLLARMYEVEDRDPITTYVAFLTAKQLWDRVRKEHPEYRASRVREAKGLERWISSLPELREALPVPDNGQRDEFLDWYEEMFLCEAVAPAEDI